MAKPELSIELHSDCYRFGDPITGCVRVTVPDDCKAERLEVMTAWQAATWTPVASVDLAASPTWVAGSEHVFDFELRAPDGPMPYQGANLEIAHVIAAQLHGDEWFIDPRASAAYELGPAPVPEISWGMETVPTTPMPRNLKQEVTAGNVGCQGDRKIQKLSQWLTDRRAWDLLTRCGA